MPLAGIPDSKRRLMVARPAEERSHLPLASQAYHHLGIYTCCSSPATWLGYLGSLLYPIKIPQVFTSAAKLGLAPLFFTLPLGNYKNPPTLVDIGHITENQSE